MRRIWYGRLCSFLLICGFSAGQTAKLMPAPLPIHGPVGGPKTPTAGNTVVPPAAVVVLRELSAQATVIFAGHVLEVQRNDAGGYVDVVFGIDHAVRGCEDAKRYVLREWAGLWADEPQRYGVGQRLLMILSSRGPSGMSAPVRGMAGKIPLLGVRQPPLARGTGEALVDNGAEDELEDAVDLRWVEAMAARTEAPGSKALVERAKSALWVGPIAPMMLSPAGVAGPGLSAVLAVLSGQ